MAIQYKQKCKACNRNYVVVSNRTRSRNIVCFECDKKQMQGEINDPAIMKLFDIPEEYYVKSSFLRNIKIGYIKYGSLSEKQIEAFKTTVERIKEDLKNAKLEEKKD